MAKQIKMDVSSTGGVVAGMSGFKSFESEGDIEERRKKRQEEWERVRKPEDPQEAPEEEQDSRCLYERLESQKQKKQDEQDEQSRLSNQVKGLDDDEAQFLELVSQKKQEVTKQREQEERTLLAEYRESVMNRTEDKSDLPPKAKTTIRPTGSQSTKKSQLSMLAGAVKRKSHDATSGSSDVKKTKEDSSPTVQEPGITTSSELSSAVEDEPSDDSKQPKSHSQDKEISQTAQVIGILPGLGAYGGSDSDDTSSESDIDLPVDIFQCRKIIMQHNHQ